MHCIRTTLVTESYAVSCFWSYCSICIEHMWFNLLFALKISSENLPLWEIIEQLLCIRFLAQFTAIASPPTRLSQQPLGKREGRDMYLTLAIISFWMVSSLELKHMDAVNNFALAVGYDVAAARFTDISFINISQINYLDKFRDFNISIFALLFSTLMKTVQRMFHNLCACVWLYNQCGRYTCVFVFICTF